LNIGKYSNKLIIKYQDKIINFNDAKSDVYSLPGQLILNYDFDDFIIHKLLIFSSNRTSLIETKITNKTNKKIDLDISVSGSVYSKIKTKSTGEVEDDSAF
jgi:putative isomerase